MDDAAKDLLVTFVTDRDAPCPNCGYSLRGLTSTTCPECAEHLELRVGMVEPRMRLWISGLVGLAAGAGFNGLLLVYIFMELARRGGPRGFVLPFLAYNAAGTLIEGGLLLAWIAQRRRFRGRDVRTRSLLAAAAWALALLNVLIFSRVVR